MMPSADHHVLVIDDLAARGVDDFYGDYAALDELICRQAFAFRAGATQRIIFNKLDIRVQLFHTGIAVYVIFISIIRISGVLCCCHQHVSWFEGGRCIPKPVFIASIG